MLRRGTMKLAIFKSKPKTPVELVRHFRHLLLFLNDNPRPRPNKRHKDKMSELSKVILEMRLVLYGFETSEPKLDACAKLTQEFFREDTFRLLIKCLPQLELGPRRDATHVIANLHRQKVNSRLIASDYMERNLDLMDILIPGYEDSEISLTYGAVARECIRHQSVARYILESNHMKKILDYIQNPSFEIASDAIETFKELLTRHKSTVAEFLSKNYNWFFQVYNTQLLESTCYISRRQAITILGEMLSDVSNTAVTTRYVSSLANMRIMMNLLMEPNKSIRKEAFHVFKLFVTNQNKPKEIYNVLVANKRKLLGFFDDFKLDKEDKNFEAAKAQIVAEIVNLRPREVACATNIVESCRIEC